MAKEKQQKLSRRSFLSGAGGVGATVAATGILGSQVMAAQSSSKPAEGRVTKELPIPVQQSGPEKTEYQCDVLVVGCGFAGLNAAMAVKESGQSVLLVDKGRPGYSGLSPWASGTRWFDKDFGDDAEAYKKYVQIGSEYMANMDWIQVWIDESKAAYERLKEWKTLMQIPVNEDSNALAKKRDYVGFREKYDAYDRHARYMTLLEEKKIECLTRTMITDVIEQNGRVVGAMGFDVPSGKLLTIHAKAVVMCMGAGSYKPTGYPTAGDTFDSEFIGYNLGLPIVGKEFDDFHQTTSVAPGHTFANNAWAYLDSMGLEGGEITGENVVEQAWAKGTNLVARRVQYAIHGLPNNDGNTSAPFKSPYMVSQVASASVSKKPGDPRKREAGKIRPLEGRSDIYGAAVGMCTHLASGIYCGLNDLVGYAGVPGLYVAGDGTHGSVVSGCTYPNGAGFTSSFCSVQGWRSGQAAAKYAGGVRLEKIAPEKAASVSKEIQAPLGLSDGMDANWARDVLQALMAPYWIHIAKNEATLRGALAQVEYMRDEVAPKLMAVTPHDLRMCLEMKHKILSAEMKLRASIERKESRGFHYRSDFPYRDDKNFLCYIAARKGKSGEMLIERINYKDEWKGDPSQPYAQRYGWRFPGEAKAKGLPEKPAGSKA